MNKNNDFNLDFNDGRTSKLERCIVYIIVICSITSALCDIAQFIRGVY